MSATETILAEMSKERIVRLVDDFAAQVNVCWMDLSPAAKAAAMKLESCLAELRNSKLGIATKQIFDADVPEGR